MPSSVQQVPKVRKGPPAYRGSEDHQEQKAPKEEGGTKAKMDQEDLRCSVGQKDRKVSFDWFHFSFLFFPFLSFQFFSVSFPFDLFSSYSFFIFFLLLSRFFSFAILLPFFLHFLNFILCLPSLLFLSVLLFCPSQFCVAVNCCWILFCSNLGFAFYLFRFLYCIL